MRLVTVTGEASGDLIAADALRRLSNGAADLELGGIGGDRLRAVGMECWFRSDDLAVRGYAEAVSIHVEGAHAAMVEINCETDFVAKNDDFLAFSSDVARLVCAGGVADVTGLSAASLSGGTVESVRTALVGKIGENISVRRFTRLAAKGKLFSYIHGGAKIGVLVDLVGGDEQLGRDLAMHIAASKPKSLDASGVDAALIETERRIAAEKAAESGKPADIVAKMVEGTVQKFLKEVTLLGQVFVKAEDGKQTIEQLLKSKGASIASFTLYIVGEGIERRADDFAAEVAAQVAAARAA